MTIKITLDFNYFVIRMVTGFILQILFSELNRNYAEYSLWIYFYVKDYFSLFAIGYSEKN